MVAQKGENLSLQDYSGMKYMDNVIKEALRMYTPVPFVARKVAQDVTLPSKILKSYSNNSIMNQQIDGDKNSSILRWFYVTSWIRS